MVMARPEAATAAGRLIIVAVPLPIAPRCRQIARSPSAIFTNGHQTLEQVVVVPDALYTVRRDLQYETNSRAAI